MLSSIVGEPPAYRSLPVLCAWALLLPIIPVSVEVVLACEYTHSSNLRRNEFTHVGASVRSTGGDGSVSYDVVQPSLSLAVYETSTDDRLDRLP